MMLLMLSLSALAKDRYNHLGVEGELTVLEPSIISLVDGKYSLGVAQACGIFKCKNKRFTFKNDQAKSEIEVSKKENFEYKISYFHRYPVSDHDFKNIDAGLNIKLLSKKGEETKKFVFTEVPEQCEDICTQTYSYCRGEVNQWGDCDSRGEETGCSESTTRCTPAYEACIEHTSAPVRLEVIISDVKTEKVAAKFISSERQYESKSKVKMANCFQ